MNNIQTISPQHQYTPQQMNTLNSIIQNLSKPDKMGEEHNMAMLLLAAGTSLGDVNLVRWVIANNHATVNDGVSQFHIDTLNKFGFNIKKLDDVYDEKEVDDEEDVEEEDWGNLR